MQAGNKTLQAAVDQGITEAILVHTDGQQLVVTVRDDLKAGDADAVRLALEDNRAGELSLSWDASVLESLLADAPAILEGLWNQAELDELLPKEPPADAGAQLDKAAELQEKWQVKTGDVWRMGKHRLYCGDSFGELPFDYLPPNLFYDPPFEIEKQMDTEQWKSVLAFCDGRYAYRVIKLFGAPAWVFTWDCVTSWYAPNRPLQRGKYCFWYGDVTQYNFDGAHYGESLKPHVVSNSRGQYQYKPNPLGKHLSDVFQSPITALHSDGEHKHEKPLDWIRLLVGDCFTGDVFDPFAGSGITFVACEQLGRRCIGAEIHPPYVAVCLERLADLGLEVQKVSSMELPL